MSVAYIVEALFEETLRELDQRAEHELWRIGSEMSYWLRHMLMRMPCDTWRYEFDRQIAKMAREHVIVAEESCRAWIERLRECNEAAEEDARAMGSADAVRVRTREYFKWPDPPQYPHDKPAPFDPDYPQLRGTGNSIMEDYPLEQWVELAHFCLQSYRVPQEIKDAFVGWLADEQHKALGFGLPPGTPVEADGQPYAVCFAAGTLVFTGRGMTPIEVVSPGDVVLAVPDGDPLVPARWCRVEQAYHNAPTELVEVHATGLPLIRASLNHPFYVQGKGFTSAAQLKPGDLLRTADDRWAPIAGTSRAGGVASVYNLCVADCHTYFVGSEQCAVLVHNASPTSPAGVDIKTGVMVRGVSFTVYIVHPPPATFGWANDKVLGKVYVYDDAENPLRAFGIAQLLSDQRDAWAMKLVQKIQAEGRPVAPAFVTNATIGAVRDGKIAVVGNSELKDVNSYYNSLSALGQAREWIISRPDAIYGRPGIGGSAFGPQVRVLKPTTIGLTRPDDVWHEDLVNVIVTGKSSRGPAQGPTMEDALPEERRPDMPNELRASKGRAAADAASAAADKAQQINREAKLDKADFNFQRYNDHWYFWFSDPDDGTAFPLTGGPPNGRAIMKNWLRVPLARINTVRE